MFNRQRMRNQMEFPIQIGCVMIERISRSDRPFFAKILKEEDYA